ncbi:hypothetical protein ABIB26_001591 [Arthrobacter sp. UYEF20]
MYLLRISVLQQITQLPVCNYAAGSHQEKG